MCPSTGTTSAPPPLRTDTYSPLLRRAPADVWSHARGSRGGSIRRTGDSPDTGSLVHGVCRAAHRDRYSGEQDRVHTLGKTSSARFPSVIVRRSERPSEAEVCSCLGYSSVVSRFACHSPERPASFPCLHNWAQFPSPPLVRDYERPLRQSPRESDLRDDA